MRKQRTKEELGPPRFKIGDLWDYHRRKYWLVITTNIGWKKDGENVMGAGIAYQAAKRFPHLPKYYGRLCKRYGEDVDIVLENQHRLIFFPVKPLNQKNPHLSWQGNATLEQIEDSLDRLLKCVNDDRMNRIAMPWPGCGNGGLSRSQVKPLLLRYLDSRFTIVRRR